MSVAERILIVVVIVYVMMVVVIVMGVGIVAVGQHTAGCSADRCVGHLGVDGRCTVGASLLHLTSWIMRKHTYIYDWVRDAVRTVAQ